jgi:hypothetical protein
MLFSRWLKTKEGHRGVQKISTAVRPVKNSTPNMGRKKGSAASKQSRENCKELPKK